MWHKQNIPPGVTAGDIGEGTNGNQTITPAPDDIQWIVADIGSNWKAGMNSADSPQFLGPALSAHNYSGRHSHSISNPGPTRWLGKAAQIAYSTCYYSGYPNEANNSKDIVCLTLSYSFLSYSLLLSYSFLLPLLLSLLLLPTLSLTLLLSYSFLLPLLLSPTLSSRTLSYSLTLSLLLSLSLSLSLPLSLSHQHNTPHHNSHAFSSSGRTCFIISVTTNSESHPKSTQYSSSTILRPPSSLEIS